MTSERLPIKAFIFDMDGTLFDTERLYRTMWFKLAPIRGFHIDDEMLDQMRGASLEYGSQVFEAANPGFSYATERAIRMEEVFRYVDREGVPKMKGLDETLAWLKAHGYKIAIGVKTHSKENPLMYALRGLYYKLIKKMSSVDQIAQFTGFGLYDHAFIDVMRQLNDPTPFLRGIVAELGFHRKEIPYTQPKRRAGITHNNLYTLYDAAMLGFTSYTKVGLRMAVFFGAACSGISMLIAIIYLIMKLIWWDRFPAGMAPMLIGMLFLGSVQIFFIGLLGEYILSINQRVMRRPLVVEEERLNFPEDAMIGGMADASK